ncbi:MAG: DNA helicase [Desulfobacteraceae bacterium]|nr:MAG: DNA helicase [Desulfobacteraceae bacterium]
MKFIADLHIHSRFSRATARNLNFPNLYRAARIKGITLVATGDFTHPGWFTEITEHLTPAEPGLFRLKDDLAAACERELPFLEPSPVRFILSGEISNIYKKNGATRKNHNLVFLPDLASAARFNARLERIGNIKSDGRPILGLDARNLLELALEISDTGFLVPAHIWTPWFSLFGSKSGFDSIEECFEDLTPHIFALETGLSSDPAMNWRVGGIDGMTLISNSDAHSPANLGREANLLDTELSYDAIRSAIQTGDPEKFLGTIEFFPEEGKYHHDGHRNCGISLPPGESIRLNDICPECGKPMTLGVLHRVDALATRPDGETPEKAHSFYRTIPLAEIIGEIADCGVKSKKVGALYDAAIRELGPELPILNTLPIDVISRSSVPFLGEAISRMREGRVHIVPGYDGEYGRITVFAPEEKDRLAGQKSLFSLPDKEKPAQKKPAIPQRNPTVTASNQATAVAEKQAADWDRDILAGLNPEQLQAVTHERGPMVIIAGPGTGKTRTLTCRIAWLIQNRQVPPEQILAITFTNKAAGEMAHRVSGMLGSKSSLPLALTFHAFCLRLLHEIAGDTKYSVIDDLDRKELMKDAVRTVKAYKPDLSLTADQAADRIACAKQLLLLPSDDLTPVTNDVPASDVQAVYAAYQQILEAQNLYDYEDLIFKTVRTLESDPELKDFYRNRLPYVFVDEYQDLNYGQYRLIRVLSPAGGNICVIGDPDQSIYGFRGSSAAYFERFGDDYPDPARIHLAKNYRSTETILEAAHGVIRQHAFNPALCRVRSGIIGEKVIRLFETESEKSEAVAVGKAIARLVGGTGFHFDDFGGNADALHGEYRAFSDIAVLYRTRRQGEAVAKVFETAGIPFQMVQKDLLFRQQGVQELIALLKITENRGSYADIAAVSDILPQNLDLNNMSVRNKLLHLADLPDIRKRLEAGTAQTREAFDRILYMAEAFGENTTDFLEAAALETDPDVFDDKSQKVALMTFHAAKGLEFPVVFIIGCENGYIPFIREKQDGPDMDEERRLFYVAMTRARDQLYLTWAKNRVIFGRKQPRRISPFVADIPGPLLERIIREYLEKPKPQIQLELF